MRRRRSPKATFWPTLAIALAALTLSACDNPSIQEHIVAKGIEHVLPQTPSDDTWPWTAPPGWIEDTTPRTMRLATYTLPDLQGDIEIAITRFAGRVGGELANINRWRSQLGLEPLDEAELESALERFETPGFEGYQSRIESTESVMLAAGLYESAEDRTWFVRAVLERPEQADRIEPQVFRFVRSIEEKLSRGEK